MAGFAGRFGCIPPPETKEELDDPMRSPYPREPGSHLMGPELPKVKHESHSVMSNSLRPHELYKEFSRPEYWNG